MSKQVKPWNDPSGVFRMSKRNHRGNNIARANIGAIETYKEIESTETASKKYPGLSVRYRGKVV